MKAQKVSIPEVLKWTNEISVEDGQIYFRMVANHKFTEGAFPNIHGWVKEWKCKTIQEAKELRGQFAK